jgi:myo-inositol 2-dehydrogenase/D-chiro-inositol 1-dehydrogenase
MEKISVGLFGAGLLGIAHALCLMSLKGAGIVDLEPALVYDPDTEKADSLVKNVGFKKTASSPEEIISAENIDVVFVATPTHTHRKYVFEATRAKKHVFCEKPLSVNLDGAREMAAAVESAGVTGGVGLVLRSSPTYTYMRDLVRTEDLGRPVLISMRDDQCLPIRGLHHTSWRVDRTKSGGGTIIEHSIHDLDLFRWFFGTPTVTQALLRCSSGHDGIEDYGRITMKFENTMEGILTSIWHDMVGRPSNRHFEVIGEKLFVATDHDFIGPIEITRGDEETIFIESEAVLDHFIESVGFAGTPHESFFRSLEYKTLGPYTVEDYLFLKAVLDGKQHTPGFNDAVRAHEIVDEIYTKAGQGGKGE